MSTNYPFFHKASANTFKKARVLRKPLTNAESILWKELRNRKLLGRKFRRQHVIGPFIADFYCNEIKLVIEADGGIHNVEEVKLNDIHRQKAIAMFGITILRFTNDEIENNINFVLEEIKKYL